MPKAYWIAQNDIHDMDTYRKYLAGSGPVFERFGGKFIVRGGRFEALQGNIRGRQIVIEFADMETALACYNSPAYKAAEVFRRAASEGDIVIVEGVAD